MNVFRSKVEVDIHVKEVQDIINGQNLRGNEKFITGLGLTFSHLYHDVGAMNEALEWCDKYIKAFPNAAIGHQHKAMIKSSQGFVREALKCLDTAHNLNQSPERKLQIVDFGLELSSTLREAPMPANAPAAWRHETWLARTSPEPAVVVAANEPVNIRSTLDRIRGMFHNIPTMLERNLLHLLDEILLVNPITAADAVSSASKVFFMGIRRHLEVELGVSQRPTNPRAVFQRKNEMDGHFQSLIGTFKNANARDRRSTISIGVPKWLGLIYGHVFQQLGDNILAYGSMLSYLDKKPDSPLCNFAVAEMLHSLGEAPEIIMKYADKAAGRVDHRLHDLRFCFPFIQLITELPATEENRQRQQVWLDILLNCTPPPEAGNAVTLLTEAIWRPLPKPEVKGRDPMQDKKAGEVGGVDELQVKTAEKEADGAMALSKTRMGQMFLFLRHPNRERDPHSLGSTTIVQQIIDGGGHLLSNLDVSPERAAINVVIAALQRHFQDFGFQEHANVN